MNLRIGTEAKQIETERRDVVVGSKLGDRDKVFGIGLGKTGTTSLAAAMKILGYKARHSPRDVDDLAKFEFSNDIAVAWRFRFLDFVYPRAKFILTVRDLSSWLLSSSTHASRHTGRSPLRRLESRFMCFGRVDYNETDFSAAYQRHVDDVLAHFKTRPGKLLVMDVCNGDGWDLLCPFIGAEKPVSPFPHHNRK